MSDTGDSLHHVSLEKGFLTQIQDTQVAVEPICIKTVRAAVLTNQNAEFSYSDAR